MTKTDASRSFGQIINYLLLEFYPLGEESPRFHYSKIVTIEQHEINWPTTAKNIIPRFLTHLPLAMIKDLEAIDKFCRESDHPYPLDMNEFTIGLTADFMNDIIWSKNEVGLKFYKATIQSMGKLNKGLNKEMTPHTIKNGDAFPEDAHEYFCNSHPVDTPRHFPAFTFVRKAWTSLISWFIVVF